LKSKAKAKSIILVSLAYFFITLIFTYPLILNIDSHFPAYGKGGDAHSFLWNSWNFKEALEDPTYNPLTAPSLLYPFEPNLVFHTYTIFRNVLVFLLSKFIPFITSFNVVTILMFTFSGVGAYLLTLRFVRAPFAAFLSGFIFSFCPFKMARLMAHYNFVDTVFIPYFLIFLYIAWSKRKILPAVAAGTCLAFIGYCSFYYLIHAFLFMAVFILYHAFPPFAHFISKKNLSKEKRRILGYSLFFFVGLSALVFFVILVRGHIRFFAFELKNANGIYLLLIFALLLGLFSRYRINFRNFISSVRAQLHSFYRDKTLLTVITIILVFFILFMPITINLFKHHEAYLVTEGTYGNSPEITNLVTPGPNSLLYKHIFELKKYGTEKMIFLGFTVLLGGIYSIFLVRKKPEIKFWQLIALIFTVHSLGPYLLIAGRKMMWLPFQITHSFPFLSAALNPSRYIIVSMLAMGILTAYAADDILSRLKQNKHRIWLSMGFCTLTLAMIGGEYATFPLSLFSLRPHQYYQEMAQDEEKYSLLELPFSISSKGKSFGIKERLGLYQYYQTIHGKNLPSGWLANLPHKIFDYYKNVSFVPSITYLQEKTTSIPPETLNSLIIPDPQFIMFLNLYNIKQINIHRGAIKANGIEYLKSYFKSQFQGAAEYSIREENDLINLRIHSDLVKTYLGENLLAPEKALDLTEGWSRWIRHQDRSGRWVTAKNANLLFSTPKKRSFRLEIDCDIPEFAPNKNQVLEIQLNSSLVDKLSYSHHVTKSITLPQDLVKPGSNIITFHFQKMSEVRITPTPAYYIGQTGTYSPVDIEISSSSRTIGFQGMSVLFPLRVGQQRIYNKFQAGYNIFVVNEKTGKILVHRAFATHSQAENSQKMSTFIDKIKSGRIVIAITWGNASASLSDESVAALRTLGANEDLREWPGYCHSIIGVKGANPGEAMEKLDLHKATLVVGQYSNADKVATWFSSIKMF
jgi:hypothetical protein